jgi:hypothetical protein
MVNNAMLFNFTDQKELGPYEGDVTIPRITESEANFELNFQLNLQHDPATFTEPKKSEIIGGS